jgi:mycothiol synthase
MEEPVPTDSDAAVEVVDVAALSDARRTGLADLIRRSAAATDHPALPEPQLHAVLGERGAEPGGRAVMAIGNGSAAVSGAAFLFPAHDGSTVLQLVTDGDTAGDPQGLADLLFGRAVVEADAQAPLHLWAMQAGPADDARARAHGFAPERDLLQLRVPLPLSPEVVAATAPLETRPFAAGLDEEAWVRTNNRAFAGHPEQGGWTVDQLRERMAADWVDLEGFLVADAPDGEGLVGSCWTKVHVDRRPALGEIYVIGVDPRFHGHGWGRSLTVAGLRSLADRGITIGMLYADADNEAAVSLYRSLGFEVDHVDRSYRRGPSG